MKSKLLALVGGVAIGASVIIGPGLVSAEKPPAPSAHRHYFENEDGDRIYIGPDFCEVEATAQGHAAFHKQVHVPGLPDGAQIVVLKEDCPQD